MFHICFAANEEYVKYACVLMTSIIKNTDSTKSFQAFFEAKSISNGGGGFKILLKSSQIQKA